jgi:hypothetical protein
VDRPTLSDLMWAPAAFFEVVVAFWFLFTGGVRRLATSPQLELPPVLILSEAKESLFPSLRSG